MLKAISILILCFVASKICDAQESSSDSCKAYSVKLANLRYQTVYFYRKGIPLSKYSWSKPQINCYINKSAIELKIKRNRMWEGVGMSFIALECLSIAPLILSQDAKVGSGILFVSGAVSLTSAYFLFKNAAKHKRRHFYYMQKLYNDAYLIKIEKNI